MEMSMEIEILRENIVYTEYSIFSLFYCLCLYVLYFVILPLISQKNSVDSINYILKH